MKKTLALLAAAAICIALAACNASTSKSFTFEADTGDKVKIEVSTSDGYDITSEVPFSVSKDGIMRFTGAFAAAESFDYYKEAVAQDAAAELLEESEKDGNAYYFYKVDSEAGAEYDYIVKVGESDTAVILGSIGLEENMAKDAFAAMSISLA